MTARDREHASGGREQGGGVFAKRSLGQNFLTDPNIARKIVAAVEAGPGSTVIEIGPGRGAMTRHLLELPDVRVAVLEKDRELARLLKGEHPELPVVITDALEFAWEKLGADGSDVRVAGNLPYNVASPIMWRLFSRAAHIRRAVFMVQLEVGRRLVAAPGSAEYGALSAWTQSFVIPKLLFKVPPHVFRPRPKVDSAVLAFTPLPQDRRPSDPAALGRTLDICFQKRRKQLGTILKPYHSKSLDIFFESLPSGRAARPEELPPERFQALSFLLSGHLHA